ncbi:MAG: ribonuclease R [Eubacterium sp.]
MNQEQMENRKKLILDLMSSDLYVPMKIKELAIMMDIAREQRPELEEVLDELMYEGKIERSKRGKYSISKVKIYTGIFEANERGFGFLRVEGETDDFFVSEKNVNGAFNEDTVQAALIPGVKGKRREVRIIKILSHGITQVVGMYQKSRNFGFVIPDNKKIARDIFIPVEHSMEAVTGHKVVVKITDYGNDVKKPEGIVTEIIGHINDPGTDIMSIIKAYDIPTEFSKEVMQQVEAVPNEVTQEEIKGREDLSNLKTVTIDGEDAKDLDDAITLTKENGIYRLGVHIADVSHYVPERSPLDKEALKRGTSVYLVDRVIPMLPHKLSNGICSLNQGVYRLALSCVMDINEQGSIVGHKISQTVIKVDRRMSYTEVKNILENTASAELIDECKELIPMFELMQELSEKLRHKRHNRGSIDFDFPESKIVLDNEGKPIDIKPYDRNVATKIIEDFMLLANETIAEDYFWQELPFVYRTHDKPDSEKMLKLGTFINNFGYSIKFSNDEVHPKELQKLLESIDATPEEALISRLTLRSMKRAQYSPECLGHYGLSAKYYCHFTSPIRRYPDLQIHRIIKENLNGGLTQKRVEHYTDILPKVSTDSSRTERRADEAERDTDKLKKVEYMHDHLGEEYEGVISGMTNWGMYVELPNTVEGMVHVNSLRGDFFEYNEETYEMVGQSTRKRYKLGQAVKVVVVRTDKLSKTIDFELVE